jgi:hypothetical protein
MMFPLASIKQCFAVEAVRGSPLLDGCRIVLCAMTVA